MLNVKREVEQLTAQTQPWLNALTMGNDKLKCSHGRPPSKIMCSLSYVSVTIDYAAKTILHLKKGALLAKTDLKEALYIIPVDPADRLLLTKQPAIH